MALNSAATSRTAAASGALALYLLLSVVLFALPILRDPATSHVGFMNDPAMMMWCMAWWPYALGQHINPFISHAVWAPSGFNLTWSASVPALATALAPVTIAWGPVISYNLAALLGPALSGWAAFLVCWNVTDNFAAALAGGMLYGFSPYEVGHVLAGHLNLTSVFLPPLCVLLALSWVKGRAGPLGFASALALLLVIQCLISTEVLATMTLFGGGALLVALAVLPLQRHRLIAALIPIAGGYAGATIILAPFLYYLFAKGSAPLTPIFPSSLFSADLLSFIAPPRWLLIYPPGAAALDSHLAADINFWEKGSYFSVPLVAVGCLYLWRNHRQPVARLLGALLLLVAVAMLGPVLHVYGHPLFPLPWVLVDALPLIRHALPIRFANYGFLIFAIIVSLWISGPRVPFRAVLAVAVLVALFPNPTYLLQKSTYSTPAFFGEGLYRAYLGRGENVLVIPYGANGPSMAWQAQSRMYFRMPGGYLGFTPQEFRRWPIVNTLLTGLPVPDVTAQLGAFAAAHGIDAMVVADGGKGVGGQFPAFAQLRGTRVGGVSFYRVTRNAAGEPPLAALQLSAADSWCTQLLCAAHRFLAERGKLDGLNPASAWALGLLPDSKWGARLDLVIAGASHGVFNGLWIGPGANGSVAAGMFVTRTMVGPLTSRYRPVASGVHFPYPQRYADHAASDDSVHFLLMTLPLESVRCPVAKPDGTAARVRFGTRAGDRFKAASFDE